jgi:hypothetical protein
MGLIKLLPFYFAAMAEALAAVFADSFASAA